MNYLPSLFGNSSAMIGSNTINSDKKKRPPAIRNYIEK